MKKNYIQPTIEVLKIQTIELLAGSLGQYDEEEIDDALSREMDW